MTDTLIERTADPRESELCSVALELLAEVGYEAMSMDALARRARASKATIYRRWSNKAELVADALRMSGVCLFSAPDTGSLREDLLHAARGFGDVTTTNGSQLFASIAHALKSDERLCSVFQERLTEPRRQIVASIVDRAIARGDIPSSARGVALFKDLLPALMLSRLTMRQPVDEEFYVELVDTVLLPVLRCQS